MMLELVTSVYFPYSCGWFDVEEACWLGIMTRLGLDYYVILYPFIIRAVSTIRLQKQFPYKCILVAVPCVHVRLM